MKRILFEAVPLCQEASTLSRQTYIPCNYPAKFLVENRDQTMYFMCDPCTSHNVKNREAKIIARLEVGRVGE